MVSPSNDERERLISLSFLEDRGNEEQQQGDNDNNDNDIIIRDSLSNGGDPAVPHFTSSSPPRHFIPQHQQSPWITSSTTPMTSRPHFERYNPHLRSTSPTRTIRRIRSRSLGSEVERANHYHQHYQMNGIEDLRTHLLVPPPQLPQLNSDSNYGSYDQCVDVEEPQDNDLRIMTSSPEEKRNSSLSATLVPDTSLSKQESTGTSISSILNHQQKQPQQQPVGEDETITTKTTGNENINNEQHLYHHHQHELDNNPVWISILYGLINATIVLPVLMSFGAIIYRDEAFSQYMPVLVKLTLASGIVHQICFSTFSSLPFAVGQVQDAGLIFLSSMASYMVQHCKSSNTNDDETMLATVTVGLSCCTALLGLGLIVVGRLKLAQYVQMLPTWYVLYNACQDNDVFFLL